MLAPVFGVNLHVLLISLGCLLVGAGVPRAEGPSIAAFALLP
jgi:hypothetical protein